jgi:hypothetical protein
MKEKERDGEKRRKRSVITATTKPQSQSKSKSNSPALNSFIYALKSSEAQRQYCMRLRLFFDFLGLHGSLEEQAETFLQKLKDNDDDDGHGGVRWTQDSIINFVNHHKQRALRKELAAGTLNNYFMAVKLFCEMNDIGATTINWKRIAGGLSKCDVKSQSKKLAGLRSWFIVMLIKLQLEIYPK